MFNFKPILEKDIDKQIQDLKQQVLIITSRAFESFEQNTDMDTIQLHEGNEFIEKVANELIKMDFISNYIHYIKNNNLERTQISIIQYSKLTCGTSDFLDVVYDHAYVQFSNHLT